MVGYVKVNKLGLVSREWVLFEEGVLSGTGIEVFGALLRFAGEFCV